VKKKRRREKNPGPPPEAILPPCKICDEKSSGYHYGANTCEACKGFFRRTLKKKEVEYKCKCKQDERDSWMKGPFKNGCPACRYERCLHVGMSKNGKSNSICRPRFVFVILKIIITNKHNTFNQMK